MAILTIPFSERKAGPYTATAGQTVFFFAFPILAATDIDVWRERVGTATLLTFGVDYTVTGVGEPAGGQITLTSGALLDDIIAIDGDLLKERATGFVGGVPFQATTIDSDLNRLAIMVQELGRKVGRSIRRAAVDESGGSLVLPQVTETTLLCLDATGDLVGRLPINLNMGAVTPYMATLLDDPTATAARSAARLAPRTTLFYVRTEPAAPRCRPRASRSMTAIISPGRATSHRRVSAAYGPMLRTSGQRRSKVSISPGLSASSSAPRAIIMERSSVTAIGWRRMTLSLSGQPN